jgi:ferredoxin-NADP reductase
MLAKLKEKREIAQGVLYVVFDLQGQDLPFMAGQFITITLINPAYTDNRGNKRYLGIINSPTEKGAIATATRVGISAFKKSLEELPVGSEVEIGPVGGHRELPLNTQTPVVLVAAGIGIVPFMGLIHYVQIQKLKYPIKLLYESTDLTQLPFLEELQAYAKENPTFTCIPLATQSFSLEIFTQYVHQPEKIACFVAGPPKRVLEMITIIKKSAVKQEQINMELFTGY